nr:MAG TPA: hypothetical protein [Caudoviricetes sp.]
MVSTCYTLIVIKAFLHNSKVMKVLLCQIIKILIIKVNRKSNII